MSRIAKRVFTALALSLLATAITGCGSGNKEGAPLVVTKVGDSKCIQCHSSVTEALTGESIVAQYQRSSPHNTPDLGCESCHGGGAMHNGVGPIPFPNPSPDRCASCHNGTRAVATNANTMFADSNHATQTIRTGTTCKRCHSHEGAVLSNIAGYTGSLEIIEDPTNQGRVPLVAEYTQINCSTCHEHGGGLRTVKATDAPAGNVVNWDPNNNRRVDQFDLCTSCHTLYNYNGTTLLVDGSTLTGGVVTGIVGQHEADWFRMLASTHYDNPNTGLGPNSVLVGPANVIEGYNLRRTGANPCFDCHGHEAKTNTRNAGTDPTVTTIHTDWAQSAHAGHLLTAKYTAAINEPTDRTAAEVAAVMNAGVIDDATLGGPGWIHYNWDQNTGTGNRAACQRCHTSTGLVNFVSNPTGYDPAANNFSHLSGWTAANGSPQNELLYCWGCHSNAGKGTLRNPGALTFTYTNNATVTYPDVSGSNMCMSCHTGRETGDSIKNDPSDGTNRNFINSHYLSAGGQLFGTTGYEYASRSYDNPSFFAHDEIGSSRARGTGSNGPCAGCHMTTANSHSFLPVTKDGTGAITAITSTACVTCHSGEFALTPAGLTTEEEEYQAALSALTATLAGKGIYYFNAHPYFFTAPYVVGGTNTGFTNWAGVYGSVLWKDVMGAAFNANLLLHDPGGYVHNRFYSKRLIWDSIDFIYDGVLNNDVPAAIDAQVTAGRLDAAVAAAAKTYLGATRP